METNQSPDMKKVKNPRAINRTNPEGRDGAGKRKQVAMKSSR